MSERMAKEYPRAGIAHCDCVVAIVLELADVYSSNSCEGSAK